MEDRIINVEQPRQSAASQLPPPIQVGSVFNLRGHFYMVRKFSTKGDLVLRRLTTQQVNEVNRVISKGSESENGQG